MEAVDLRDVPVVDNHCHGILRTQNFDDPASWRRAFTESADPGMPRDHVATTAFYRRLIRRLADLFECGPDEGAVLAARTQRNAADLTGELLRSANVEALLIDTGYPPPEEVLAGDELGKLADCLTEPMLRLEILMERVLGEHDSLQEVEVALAAALDDVRGRGYVALKSIAAYRTGLAVREWTDVEAEASLREYWRASEEGRTRLAHKPCWIHCCTWPSRRRRGRRCRSSSTPATATPTRTSCSETRCTCAPCSRSRSTAAC